jgi:hypothetical protein
MHMTAYVLYSLLGLLKMIDFPSWAKDRLALSFQGYGKASSKNNRRSLEKQHVSSAHQSDELPELCLWK